MTNIEFVKNIIGFRIDSLDESIIRNIIMYEIEPIIDPDEIFDKKNRCALYRIAIFISGRYWNRNLKSISDSGSSISFNTDYDIKADIARESGCADLINEFIGDNTQSFARWVF